MESAYARCPSYQTSHFIDEFQKAANQIAMRIRDSHKRTTSWLEFPRLRQVTCLNANGTNHLRALATGGRRV